MRAKQIPPAVWILAAISLPGCFRTFDKSEFQEFDYKQSPALGFCPRLDSVLEASLRRQPDGSTTLSVSLIEEAAPDSPDCNDFVVFNAECVVVRELPQRTLTTAEAARVAAVFRRLRVNTTFIGAPVVCIDPCRMDLVTWDGFGLSADLAGCVFGVIRLLDRDDMDEILALLEELALTSDGG